MARKETLPDGYGKLLDAWEARDGSGEPIGCVATTFTFSPAFFEEECLARFLNLRTDAAEDGPLYLVEREEKLRQLSCAAVIVDQHHCQGLRSLRWDLHAARPAKGILHAKVSLLCWSRLVRVIVASANLTEDGYRRNREVYGVLDYYEGSEAPLAFLKEMLSFLRTCFKLTGISGADAPIQRSEKLVDRASRMTATWGDSPEKHARRAFRVLPLITGLGKQDLFSQVANMWSPNNAPTHAYVVSPFYDPPEARQNRPAEAIWGVMAKRDAAHVAYCVESEKPEDGPGLLLKAPESLITSSPVRVSCVVGIRELKPDGERPLHAKEMWFESERWAALLIGSSNFTSPGTGVGKVANLEANILYLVNRDRAEKGSYVALKRRFPPSVDITEPRDKWKFLPCGVDDSDSPGDAPVLPLGFVSAVYRLLGTGQARVDLILGDDLPSGWAVATDDNLSVATETTWGSSSRMNPFSLPWHGRPPSGFWVTWTGTAARAWWPVNVASADDLPPPDDLKELPLEVLFGILTSASPLHEVMRGYLRKLQRAKAGENSDRAVEFDPHKRVDTSGFLLQRTRRFSWALAGLRARLERPVPTEECLSWRLHGPIGVMAVANALSREATSEEEKCFLIAELALELTRVRPQTSPGSLSSAHVRKALGELAQQIHARLQVADRGTRGSLNQYLAKVANHIKAP